jgi:hypothetical protein
MYTRENDTTWVECGRGSDLELKVLAGMLSKLSVDPSSGDFINPPGTLYANFLRPGHEVTTTEGDAHAGRY